MLDKITKDEINGSDLYFLKKLHLVLILVGFLIFNTFSFAGLYYSLKEDIKQNTTDVIQNNKSIETLRRAILVLILLTAKWF